MHNKNINTVSVYQDKQNSKRNKNQEIETELGTIAKVALLGNFKGKILLSDARYSFMIIRDSSSITVTKLNVNTRSFK